MALARTEAKESPYRRISKEEAFFVTSVKISPQHRLEYAVHKNDEAKTLAAIEEGANANALMMKDRAHLGNDVWIVTQEVSLLQQAVEGLNFNIIRLLLIHGADPNMVNRKNEMTLEFFLLTVVNKTLEEISSKRSAKPISHDRFKNENAILDLLLCYGMNPSPQFSKEFLEAQQIIERTLELVTFHTLSSQFRPILTEIKHEDAKKTSASRKEMKSARTKAFFAQFKRGKQRQHQLGFQLKQSLKQFPEEIKRASQSISHDKTAVMKRYQSAVRQGSRQQFSLPLINLILQYALQSFEINERVFARRQANGRGIRFWQPEQVESQQIQKQEKQLMLQQFALFFRLLKALPSSFENAEGRLLDTTDICNLIASYAVEPAQSLRMSSR